VCKRFITSHVLQVEAVFLCSAFRLGKDDICLIHRTFHPLIFGYDLWDPKWPLKKIDSFVLYVSRLYLSACVQPNLRRHRCIISPSYCVLLNKILFV
jgi:hypothetical protein